MPVYIKLSINHKLLSIAWTHPSSSHCHNWLHQRSPKINRLNKVNMVLNVHRNLCLMSTERLIRDREMGVWRWGERETIYLSLHCHQQNDFCIKTGSDESHFKFSVGSDGQSHKTVSTNHILFRLNLRWNPFDFTQGWSTRYWWVCFDAILLPAPQP